MTKTNIKLNKKQNKNELIVIPSERVISKIFLIRGKKIMVNRNLAELYGVETKVLNQAVKRNLKRFPIDFMFRLNKQETKIWQTEIIYPNLKSQFVISSPRSQIVTLKHKLDLEKIKT
ncbi:MAG: ORF6N domain-containing protein [Patescibacteria group bacterium]